MKNKEDPTYISFFDVIDKLVSGKPVSDLEEKIDSLNLSYEFPWERVGWRHIFKALRLENRISLGESVADVYGKRNPDACQRRARNVLLEAKIRYKLDDY